MEKVVPSSGAAVEPQHGGQDPRVPSRALAAAFWTPAAIVAAALVAPAAGAQDVAVLLIAGVVASLAVIAVDLVRPGDTAPTLGGLNRQWQAHVAGAIGAAVVLFAGGVVSAAAIAVVSTMIALSGVTVSYLVLHQISARATLERDAGRSTPVEESVHDAEPLVLIGARGAARAAATWRGYRVVAVVDDDIGQHGRVVAGVTVAGRSDELATIAHECGATRALLTNPLATSTQVRHAQMLCDDAGVQLLVLPPPSEDEPDQVDERTFRAPTLADLFARAPRPASLEAALHALDGRSVLVTGAAGDLGAPICRRLAELRVSEIHALDRNQKGLDRLRLTGVDDPRLETHMLDLRRGAEVRRLLAEVQPDIVIHAAALTDAVELESDPRVALLGNVQVTRHLIDAAIATGVGRFVHLSGAEAAEPNTILGQTKRLAEQMVTAAEFGEGATAVSIRLGSVLDTMGCRLGVLSRAIDAHDTIELSHPDAQVSFLTLPDAVDLTLAVATLSSDSGVVLAELADPVRELDVVAHLADDDPFEIPVTYEIGHVARPANGIRGADDVAVRHETLPLWSIPSTEVAPAAIEELLALDGEELRSHLRAATAPEDGGAGLSILLSPPDVTAHERAALERAFDSGWIAPAGPELAAFEAELCDYTGAEAAVALSSGSAALHLALVARGIGVGDEVIVQSATFAATAFAVTYTGATPVFCDIDRTTMTLDAELVGHIIEQRAAEGRPIAAVMPVDIYGMVADYRALRAVCEPAGVPIIQDAAESLGSFAFGRAAGTHGDVGAVSFNGNKIMTTSGGGALLGPADVIDHVRKLSTQAREPVPHYEHAHIGFNYRLSNLLAAMGRAQLGRLDGMVQRRGEIAALYSDALPELDWFPEGVTDRPNHWLSVALLPEGADVDHVCRGLAAQGIEARHAWYPMHTQPVFAEHEVHGGAVAEELFRRGICLPSGSTLQHHEQLFVIDRVKRLLTTRTVARAVA